MDNVSVTGSLCTWCFARLLRNKRTEPPCQRFFRLLETEASLLEHAGANHVCANSQDQACGRTEIDGILQADRDATMICTSAGGAIVSNLLTLCVLARPFNFAVIQDNYTAAVGTDEVVTGEERQETKDFIEAIMATPCMQYAHQYLVAKDAAPESETEFKVRAKCRNLKHGRRAGEGNVQFHRSPALARQCVTPLDCHKGWRVFLLEICQRRPCKCCLC